MKVIKSLAVTALMAVSTTASAQFTDTESTLSSSAGTEDWSTFYVQWNQTSFSHFSKGCPELFTGFSIGYNTAINILQNTPLFVEAGFGLQYLFHTHDLTEEFGLEDYTEDVSPEIKYDMVSVKIPVSLVCNWQIPNSKIAIAHFAGINLRYYISGNEKLTWNMSSEFENMLRNESGMSYEEFNDHYGDKDKDLFNKRDMGSDDAAWNRFQIGWQVGVNARFNNSFLFGLSYGSDFSKIFKKCRINTATSITLGYCF